MLVSSLDFTYFMVNFGRLLSFDIDTDPQAACVALWLLFLNELRIIIRCLLFHDHVPEIYPTPDIAIAASGQSRNDILVTLF